MGRKAKYLYLVLSLSLDRRRRGNVTREGSWADLMRQTYIASECWKSQIPFPRTLILNFSMGWCPRTDLPSRTPLYPPHGLLAKRKVVTGGYWQTRLLRLYRPRKLSSYISIQTQKFVRTSLKDLWYDKEHCVWEILGKMALLAITSQVHWTCADR